MARKMSKRRAALQREFEAELAMLRGTYPQAFPALCTVFVRYLRGELTQIGTLRLANRAIAEARSRGPRGR